MAPQAIAHRRGGTHKVRDEDRTDSIYDTYNYKELLDTTKERGIYRKDMKKVEMAWALKRNDEEKKKAEHQAKMEHERKQQEAQKEREKKAAQRQALNAAKHKRRLEKTQERDRDESVSDETLSDTEIKLEAYTRNEYACEPIGEVLSDESWDSTSTESSTRSTDYIPKHDCKLRLFEWPYDYMPRPDSTPLTIADLAKLRAYTQRPNTSSSPFTARDRPPPQRRHRNGHVLGGQNTRSRHDCSYVLSSIFTKRKQTASGYVSEVVFGGSEAVACEGEGQWHKGGSQEEA